MAKICESCGAQWSDDAKICGQCGKPLPEQPAKPEKKKSFGKKIKTFFIWLLVLAVVILALNIASGFMGYKGLTREIMKAYKDYDLDTMVENSSWFAYMGNESYARSSLSDNITSDMQRFEGKVGPKCRLSYKVVDSYKMPEYRAVSLMENLPASEKWNPDKHISKIVCVEIEITAKGDGNYTENMQLVLLKEKGDWKMLYLY